MSTLGTKLSRMRNKKGFSQDEVAARLKVSQPAYHKWETGLTRPTNENLAKICDLFEIDIEELLDDNTSIFSHNTISNATVLNTPNSTISNIHINSPELIQSLLDSQKEMSKLMEMQAKLIDKLLDNH